MKPVTKKIKFVLLCLVAFFLTSYIRLVPICISAFVTVWLIEGDYKRKFNALIHNRYALLFTVFYLIHLIGMLYTPEVQSGWFDLEVKLSLLVFPVTLVSEDKIGAEQQKAFVFAFSMGAILNGLVCIAYATWRYINQGIWEFLYSQLSLFLHPGYFSMYIDLALVFIFYMIASPQYNLKKYERIYAYCAVFFLEFLLLLLLSKTGLIVSVIVIGFAVLKYGRLKKFRTLIIVFLTGTAIIYFAADRFIVSANYSRIGYAEKTIASGDMNKKSTESTQVRYFVWHADWELIKKYPFTGLGTGYVRDALQLQYKKDQAEGALELKLNAHNEYMQCALELGVFGLALLLVCLLLPFFKSMKEHRYVYVMFIIIIMVNFLTESVLETQGGTMFYGLFNSLLMFNFVI